MLYDGDGSNIGRHARLLVYGETKSGKSMLGTTMPGPRVLLATEENAVLATHTTLDEVPRVYRDGDATRAATRVLRITAWEDIWEALGRIEQDARKYRSLVVDTMSGLIDLLLDDIRREVGGKKREQLSQEDWGIVNARLQSFRTVINRIPLHTLYLAHLRPASPGAPATRTRPAQPARSAGPDIPGGQAERFCADCSAVLYTQAWPTARGNEYRLYTQPTGDIRVGLNVPANRVAPIEAPDLYVFLARLGGGYLSAEETARVLLNVPEMPRLPLDEPTGPDNTPGDDQGF